MNQSDSETAYARRNQTAAKKVLVLGATGGTGREVVAQALQRGHLVTALVRDPGRLPLTSERLRVIAGSVTDDDPALLAGVVRGQDVVISTLGVGKSFRSGGLIARAVPRLVRAMESEGVKRLVFTSAFGVGETYRDVPLVPRIFIGLLLRGIYRDKAAGEAEIRRSHLDWTIVHPTGLADRLAAGRCRHGERLALHGFPTIARADVAGFLLAQIDDTTYVRKGVLISS